MGTLSNFDQITKIISEKGYRILIPELPIFDLPLLKTSAKEISNFLSEFISKLKLKNVILLGNSLGGHIALIYTIKNQSNVKGLILTGSSGLYEKSMGETFPRREDYEYIKLKTQEVFYDPKVASKKLIDSVYKNVNNRKRAIRILALAKSAIRHNLSKELKIIQIPTLLIWGNNDQVTPPEVAKEFKNLIKNSTIRWIDKCGHAPMMEHPIIFSNFCLKWLKITDEN